MRVGLAHCMPMVRFTVTNRARVVLLALAAIACAPSPARAQMEQWLSPTLGELMARGEYRITYYPDQRVQQQPAELGLIEHRLSLFVPLWQNSTDEFSLSGSALFQDLDTRAILPTRSRPSPISCGTCGSRPRTATGSRTAGPPAGRSRSARRATSRSTAGTR